MKAFIIFLATLAATVHQAELASVQSPDKIIIFGSGCKNPTSLNEVFKSTPAKSSVELSPFKVLLRSHGVVIMADDPSVKISAFVIQSLDTNHRFSSGGREASIIIDSCNHVNVSTKHYALCFKMYVNSAYY